ncbi:hypothetical protein LTR37_006634 [Vermiconidia calcicola]|uniref:Uncharacterized protein n=1 Tax=Vermiconidia calcicola TaxID=1690605 RepID=A0ACC3NFU3_9PEZI|nr:hypothetical protein LTR37_006634 [Vermiconidia calcicola]
MTETTEDEDDLKLVQASAGLLSNLEAALPKLLWRQSKTGSGRGQVHRQVKQHDLDYVIKLIEPFQGEPQLLDARLKHVLPPIIEAYIESLQFSPDIKPKEHIDLQSAICIILYTLCKVRGHKIVLGFLNNEPRCLEPILTRLEDVLRAGDDAPVEWQVPYVLLLWLSHLLLTPFDLASISSQAYPREDFDRLRLAQELPPVVTRLLSAAFKLLPAPTKAQDAAAMLLVRLMTRPDMHKLRLADPIVAQCLESLREQSTDIPKTVYERLGPLRLLSAVSASTELEYLIPKVYRTCQELSANDDPTVNSNAVAKKLMVKIFRNIAIISLRSSTAQGTLSDFLESTSILEDTIDYILTSIGDRDTPVRYAAAKALSRIILELDPTMGYEVIQAILDTFKEDLPRQSEALDFKTANALKWHGLTLALAHTLFKRSASPEQLPDILNALVSALQFEQRTATGSSVGTNVRDAANFGIWSLSRRYTTDELLSVDAAAAKMLLSTNEGQSVIQGLAIQLILSSCLDPVGNVRRGSSAALQELVGRHPNKAHEGISLVQTVDYQAVGLRRRAMVDVLYRAAEMEKSYWNASVDGLLGWRGLGSADVASREAAAAALARLGTSSYDRDRRVLEKVKLRLLDHSPNDAEGLHGLALSMACLVEEFNVSSSDAATVNGERKQHPEIDCWTVMEVLQRSTKDFSHRLLRSELPSAAGRLLAALCNNQLMYKFNHTNIPFDTLEILTDRLLSHREETIQQVIPPFLKSLLALKRKANVPLGSIGALSMARKVAIEGSKSTRSGACRAIGLGALAAQYEDGLKGEKAAAAINSTANLTEAMNVDWRIVGVKALQHAVDSVEGVESIEQDIAVTIVNAVHRGLNDYTIDERGDVGSLVRLQAIACASSIFATPGFKRDAALLQTLYADIHRLSLEKLDRVRLDAAHCRLRHLDSKPASFDVASVSSNAYFTESLRPLVENAPAWKNRALLEGCISCAGTSSENLLQNSRSALVLLLQETNSEQLESILSIFTNILTSLLVEGNNMHPALELLAFLLDMQIPQRLAESDFKWRNVLSTIQKSHHKSNDIPKISAAVNVYRGLADVAVIREEVLKKLLSMLKTNPYPRIRSSVAGALFVITREPELKSRDWMNPASKNMDVIEQLQQRYLNG